MQEEISIIKHNFLLNMRIVFVVAIILSIEILIVINTI